MKIVKAKTMGEADRVVVEELGLPGAVLMETAGLRVVEFVRHVRPGAVRIVVLAGPGNNGGDGLVTARLLEQAGLKTTLWSTVKAGSYKGDAGINEKHLLKKSYPIHRLAGSEDMIAFRRDLEQVDLVIDALFGSGLERNIEGISKEAVEAVNGSGVDVLSVDLPSGINADSGAVMGCAIRAKWTVTFAAPKRGLLLFPGAGLAGETVVGSINIPPMLFEDEPLDLVTASYVRALLPERPLDAHKGSVGRVLIVAGSPGMTGAAVLAAESALKSGSGLVYLAAPESTCAALEAKTTEVIILSLPEKEPGVIDPLSAEQIIEKARTCDVLAVGPGLDTGSATAELLNKLVQLSPVPMVFDAGALGAFGRKMNMLRSARHLPVVTPHPGEMARLIGTSTGEIQAARIEIALKNAALWNCIILLKGPNSIIAAPDGRVSINPTGGPSLATAGSGDILTGLVASFIAQGITPRHAACAAAYLHGLAGDLVQPGRGHAAGAVLERFKEAFRVLDRVETSVGGNPWLTALRPVKRAAGGP